MTGPSPQVSLFTLLGIVGLASVAIALSRWIPPVPWGVLQSLVLIPVGLVYLFSWSMAFVMAPALIGILPGAGESWTTFRWGVAITVAAAQSVGLVTLSGYPASVSLTLVAGLGILSAIFGIAVRESLQT